MEYKAKRNMNYKGVPYEKNQFIQIDSDDEAKFLQKFNFIQKRGRKVKKK